MQFAHFPDRPEELTAEFLESEYAKLTAALETAETSDSPGAWLGLFEDWNELKAYVDGEGSRRAYRLSKDMRNEEAEAADRYHREKLRPVAEAADSKLVQALLGSRHRDAVGERYGYQLLCHLDTQKEPLAPVNSELRVEAGELAHEYDKTVAGGQVEVGGEKLTLARAAGKLSSEKPAVRKEAFFAHRGWFLEQREPLGGIFQKLVERRDRMGRNLGHPNFVPLGYLGMARTDYGPEEAAAFRASIHRHASPVFERLCEHQARALGTPTLKPWDGAFHPELTLPSGVAKPVDGQLDKAERVFELLSPRLGAHFRRMRREGLIDLENREGKRAGAFCTEFADEKRVAILCNSVGDMGDVSTLMHETGHAFMGWEAQEIEAIDLRWPTADASEIHSMGMEYLSQRHMDSFFSEEDARKFIASRFARAVRLLCYISLVDEFQHEVYENPGATLDERDRTWCRIAARYMPGIDWSGVEELAATRWYAQLHIFRYPFYYIDYGIAETGAMQLALIDSSDHEKGLDTYFRLCRIGGTESVLGIFEKAGMRSPFDPELMGELMEYAAARIGLG